MPRSLHEVVVILSRVLAVLLVLMPLVGEAQGPRTTPREEALVLFRRAVVHFERGEHNVAEGLLRSAYDAFPEPVLLFNLGLALERLERREEALETYARYVDRHPGAADVEEARRRIEAIHVAIHVALDVAQRDERPPVGADRDAQSADGVDTDRAQPTEPSRLDDPPTTEAPVGGESSRVTPTSERPSLAGPTSLLVGGVALLAAGVGVGAVSRSAANRARDDDTSQVEASREYERASSRARWANVGLSIGGALVATSVMWLAVRIKRRQSHTVSLAVGVGTLSLQGRW